MVKKRLYIKQTISTVVLAIVLSGSADALATPYSLLKDSRRTVPPAQVVQSQDIVTIGPCKAYTADVNNDMGIGASIALKCPAGAIGHIAWLSPPGAQPRALKQEDPDSWFTGGMDYVFKAGEEPGWDDGPPRQINPFSKTSATLLEYAIGQPDNSYIPALVTLSDPKKVIISYKISQCPYNVDGVYQKQPDVILNGYTVDSMGGFMCGPNPHPKTILKGIILLPHTGWPFYDRP